jgi:hypothetical protein
MTRGAKVSVGLASPRLPHLSQFRPRDSVHTGIGELGARAQLAYVSLAELRNVRGKLGLPVERDEHFDADKALSACADEARQHGHVVT